MTRRRALGLLLLIGLLLTGLIWRSRLPKGGEPAETVATQLLIPVSQAGVVYLESRPGAFEGPHSFSVYDQIAYLLDAGNNRVLMLDTSTGRQSGTITYPEIYYPSEIRFDGQQLHLLDRSRQRYLLLDSLGKVASDTPAPDDVTLVQDGEGVHLHVRTTPRTYKSVQEESISWGAGLRGPISVRVSSGLQFPLQSQHLMAGADLLGMDDSGFYFVVEELLDSPTIEAERSVRWYSPEGKLKGIYEVPFWEYHLFPNTDLAFDPVSGAVYNLIPREQEIEIRQVTWTAPARYVGRLSRREQGTEDQ